MVLTNVEYQKAKSDPSLFSFFKLRNSTKSYIIQCLADREIQYTVNHLKQSKAYRYNCEVIHSPDKYYDVEAVDGVGWNSDICKPRKLRYLRADIRNGQSNNILKQITKKDKTIANLKEDKKYLEEIYGESICRFEDETFQQSQKRKELESLLSEKDIDISRLKVETTAKIHQLHQVLYAKEKTILALNQKIDDLKEIQIYLEEIHEELICRLTAVVSDKEKTNFPFKISNERLQSELININANSRKINSWKLFFCAGICLVAYKCYKMKTFS